ncbi:hypothetical protein EIN_380040 [Entamoeba invadens IP1]|uniref:Rab-GAP TBC domain-containing protein n=1 Tax=Entamoeba invadens IP1 TaxID=370355 RepID=A0A0A1UAM5_ENTIV|nr:hypothetical protein EIN_380040 [Entamoeba invadens IP1]ELP92107.1 hypothetical protein EIN_380040 [Entamoeba invadens IP1]|eukprot:XP_004258878.1 hypothetical protein EIN_380040 [Entamoeba invadens IP1]
MINLLAQYNVDDHTISPLPPPAGNRFGFFLEEGVDQISKCETLTPSQIQHEETRAVKWKRMLETWKQNGSIPKKLKSRVYKGVPLPSRADYWKLVTKQYVLEENDENIDQLFYNIESIADDVQIDLDVKRTLGLHYLFQTDFKMGRRELFLILRAISQKNNDLGYTQGMSDFAGILFSILKERLATYKMMEMILNNPKYNLKPCLQVGFPGLIELGKINDLMLKNIHHTSYRHLVALGYLDLDIHVYMFDWYMVWFSRILPCDFLYAVFDFCLLDGYKAMFTIANAIVHYLKHHILECDDIYIAMQLLKAPADKLLQEVKCSTFVAYCRGHKVTQKMIDKWKSAK